MRLSETVIWYTPQSVTDMQTAGQIELTTLGNEPSSEYSSSTGACYLKVKEMNSKEQNCWIYNLAVHLIVRDRINPKTVHEALSEIRQYRDGLAHDVPMPQHLKRIFQIELKED